MFVGAASLDVAATVVPKNYLKHAQYAHDHFSKLTRSILAQRRLPDKGLDDLHISMIVNELASMDTNNFIDNVSVGEREGRICSELVATRNFHFGHGIGRSGDINKPQPKAIGSSLLYQLTNILTTDALHVAGLTLCSACLVLPLATGMAISATLSALRNERKNAKYVLWNRVDQKSALKAIAFAGFTPIVIENEFVDDGLKCDIAKLEEQIILHGNDILCVLSNTSAFAPRIPDDIPQISELCKRYNIPHIVNNAFGVSSSKSCHLINEGLRKGRLDAFIQSTDKNFLVPVGGAIVASSNTDFLQKIASSYPGRATISPIVDLFITLLHIGKEGYLKLLTQQKALHEQGLIEIKKICAELGEQVLSTKDNKISIGITIDTLGKGILGPMLYLKNCSGCRECSNDNSVEVCGIVLQGFGAHCVSYPHQYLTFSTSIGQTSEELQKFFEKLRKCFSAAKQKAPKELEKVDAKEHSSLAQ